MRRLARLILIAATNIAPAFAEGDTTAAKNAPCHGTVSDPTG